MRTKRAREKEREREKIRRKYKNINNSRTEILSETEMCVCSYILG